MKYINPSFSEICELDFYTKIALVAHNCYQVDRNDKPKEFVKRLIGFKHLAMIEHYHFVADISKSFYQELINFNSPFLILVNKNDKYYVNFTLRILLEDYESKKSKVLEGLISLLPDDIIELFPNFTKSISFNGKLLTEDEVNNLPYDLFYKLKDVSLKIITDRGVTHELVRHRLASYAQESTRYCNYAKNKFGNELTFITPLDYDLHKQDYDKTFSFIEKEYIYMINDLRMTAEMARAILPNKLKASIIITANIEEFDKIFALRLDPHAHPDIRLVFKPIKEYFINKGYLQNGKTF